MYNGQQDDGNNGDYGDDRGDLDSSQRDTQKGKDNSGSSRRGSGR